MKKLFNYTKGKKIRIGMVLLFLFISNSLTSAQGDDFETKIVASDIALADHFGNAVDINGTTVIIGKEGDNSNGYNSGAAYIFQYNGKDWMQQQKLTASDGATDDNFGKSVAVDGNIAIVGAPFDDDNSPGSGSAYIFQYNGSSWVQFQKLTASDGEADDNFGYSVAISGDWAFVGAYLDDNGWLENSGSVYIYRFNGSNWIQRQKLFINLGEEHRYGNSVDISGNTAIIGAYYYYLEYGRAYIYQLNGNSWTEQQVLNGFAAGEHFGNSVSISGNTAVIGAPNNDDNGTDYGAAYIFEFNGSNWDYINQLTAGDGEESDQFGSAVSISDNNVVIGAPYKDSGGSAYLFQYDGNEWDQQSKITASDGSDYDWFGTSVGISGNISIVGAYGYESNTSLGYNSGSAYIYEHLYRPAVTASNGTSDNRIKVSWESNTERTERYYVYRDGGLIDSTVAGSRAYYDYDAVPGKIYEYSVEARSATWGTSLRQESGGWKRTNGQLDGTVKTPYGANVDNVEITVNSTDVQLNSCLQFDGNDDYVITNPFKDFPSEAFTISFWMNTDDAGNTHPFSYAIPDTDNCVLIAQPSNMNIFIGGEETGGTEIAINDDTWHHLAVTWQNSDGEISILKDGVLVFTGMLQKDYSIPDSGSVVLGQDQDNVGGGFNPAQAFGGLLDEVRIWNKVRTMEEIQADMYQKLKGDEPGLVSYWTFDDLPDRAPDGMTGDYAEEGGNHGEIFGPVYLNDTSPMQSILITDDYGSFSLNNVYYGESAQFEFVPFKEGHKFDPQDKIVELTLDASVQSSIEFTDTTALTIIGEISYAGTDCKVSGVEMFLDDVSTGKFTDSNGQFIITIEQPGEYELKPFYHDTASTHKFNPASIKLNVQESILDLEFADTTHHVLRGKFSAACENIIGTAQIVLSSIGNNAGCFSDTIETDQYGDYRIILPAQTYMIEIVAVDVSSLLPDEVLGYFNADTVDLTWQDVEHNFVYRNAPIIKVSGWPELGGGAYNVPIMEQGELYDLEIEVLDVWEGDTCHVNQGSVTIYDDLADLASEPVTLVLKDGLAEYECRPGQPNLLSGGDHPYQKLFNLVANIGENTVDYTQWAVVTGGKQRGSEFYTIPTPEIAFWVLHDPPGDESYSFFQKDSTYTKSVRSSWHYQGGGGFFGDLQMGLITSIGTWAGFGGGASYEVDGGAYAIVDYSFLWGRDKETTHTKIVSFTASQEFRTSDSDLIVGEEGDVYIGASFNDEFALADILKFDWEQNIPDRDTALVYLRTNFGTDFIYTESHIMQTMVPQLKELSWIAAANGDEAKAKTYRSHAESWEQQVFQHHQIKADDHPDTKMYKNYSFSAGTYTTNSFTTHPTDTAWLNFDQLTFDYEGKLGMGSVILGCTYEVGLQGYYHTVAGDEHETQITTSETYGYTLADDDPGDFFSVDVRYRYKTLEDGTEEFYGAPIFNLVTGVSSSPWEKGSQARDGVNMAINKYAQYNIPPDEQAPFILYLGNTSESDEEREYHLSVIQSSNLDGAVIRVGGVVIEDHLSYTIPAGEQLNATMTVERGPIAYDYENLKIRFYAPGDEENIADTLTFSVQFISPCADVNLLLPEDNWVLNALNSDTMQFVLNEYEADNEYLKSLKLQYRRRGEEWNTAFTYYKDDLPPDYIIEYWNISNLPDGEYELRAVSDCGQKGLKYSQIATGVIDRSTLLVFGSPQPSDGVLNIGEDISISWSSDIDEAYLSAENNISMVTLDDSTPVYVTVACHENTIIITPLVDLVSLEGKKLQVTVKNLRDINGNRQTNSVTWNFTINQNAFYWLTSYISQTAYQGSENTFKTTLKNSSGQAQSFTLSSLPSWLSANPQSGSVPMDGTQEITFTVSNQLNIGLYTDTVFVDVTNQGYEPLYVDVSVLSSPPDWQVISSAYQYSMSIVARLKENGGFSSDENDIVAAFMGDENRGIANLQYVSDDAGYLAFITVYSNQQSGEVISFRSWDASEGEESGYISETVIFENNGAAGTLESPLLIVPIGKAQNIALEHNWNWFSFNVEYDDMSVNTVLSSLNASEGDLVKSQTAMAMYSERYGWQGNLSFFEVGKSYQINLAQEQNLRFGGMEVDCESQSIPVMTGWNWIAYLPQKILDINAALNSFSAASGDHIRSQDQFAVYDNTTNSWQGDLQYLSPGEGYLLNSANSGMLTYSGANPEVNITRALSAAKSNLTEDILKPQLYETNMSFIGHIQTGALVSQDTTLILTAFCGGSIRGQAVLEYYPEIEDYLVFLTVYGSNSSGDSLYFVVTNPSTNEEIEINGKTVYVPNAVQGNLRTPFAFVIKDEIAPGIDAAFHYSSEASLANHIRLYISSNEMLLKNPVVQIASLGQTPLSKNSQIFDADKNIYVLDYKVEQFGENTFFITATDLSDNITQQQMVLNVQNIQLNKSATYTVDENLSISVDGSAILEEGLLFTESAGKDTSTLSENLTMLSDIYTLKSTATLKGELNLCYKLDKIDMDEIEKRKIGLYRFEETESEWIYVSGQGGKLHLDARIKDFETYAVIYNKEMIPVPKEFALHHNYPNPFNPSTTLRFNLPSNEKVTMTIYNILGQKVRTLVNANYEAGYHKVTWNGKNDFGEKTASGLYIYRIKAGKFIKSHKMILLK